LADCVGDDITNTCSSASEGMTIISIINNYYSAVSIIFYYIKTSLNTHQYPLNPTWAGAGA